MALSPTTLCKSGSGKRRAFVFVCACVCFGGALRRWLEEAASACAPAFAGPRREGMYLSQRSGVYLREMGMGAVGGVSEGDARPGPAHVVGEPPGARVDVGIVRGPGRAGGGMRGAAGTCTPAARSGASRLRQGPDSVRGEWRVVAHVCLGVGQRAFEVCYRLTPPVGH